MSAPAPSSIAAISWSGGEVKGGPAVICVREREFRVLAEQAAHAIPVAGRRGVSELLNAHNAAHEIRFSRNRLSGSSMYGPNGATR